jgi:hypothetical protein
MICMDSLYLWLFRGYMYLFCEGCSLIKFDNGRDRLSGRSSIIFVGGGLSAKIIHVHN